MRILAALLFVLLTALAIESTPSLPWAATLLATALGGLALARHGANRAPKPVKIWIRR